MPDRIRHYKRCTCDNFGGSRCEYCWQELLAERDAARGTLASAADFLNTLLRENYGQEAQVRRCEDLEEWRKALAGLVAGARHGERFLAITEANRLRKALEPFAAFAEYARTVRLSYHITGGIVPPRLLETEDFLRAAEAVKEAKS